MKPRILIVQFSARRDGSTLSALSLARGLREGGWEVHVAFAASGPMEKVFADQGCTTAVVPHKNWLRATTYWGTTRNVLRECRSIAAFGAHIEHVDPDAVYVNSAASWAGAIAARRRKRPYVWHLRELFDDQGGELSLPSGLRTFARAQFVRGADRLVANSRVVADNLLGAHAAKAEIVPNAVDDRFFDEARTVREARVLLGVPQDGSVIGVPATLRPVKGLPFFFRAVAPVLAADSSVLALVSGDGRAAYKQELMAQVADLGIEERVRFLGTLDDMPAFYRACDVVCVPSVSESFGRSVIEAFAVGTAVVATDVGGIPEVVEDGRNGRLVAYGDEAGLGGILAALLTDAQARVTLGQSARADAEQRYRAECYQMRLRRVIEQVLLGMPPIASR